MAKVCGKIGCLTQLLNILRANGIDDFETMDDIRLFRNNYKNSLEEIKRKCEGVLQKEVSNSESSYEKLGKEVSLLKSELQKLCDQIDQKGNQKGFIASIKHFFRKRAKLSKKKYLEILVTKKDGVLLNLKNNIIDKKNNPNTWIEQYASDEIKRHEKILTVFRENRNLFYGAEGEERVVLELSGLPDTYTIINDYRLNFVSPIYDRRNNDRIYSVQIDHIIFGPTGMYLIETKNWSKASAENINLFSPVKQLRRHSFAMFVLLNQAVEEKRIKNFSNHWGDKKISPKNIICMINHAPQQEFQYVKILSLREITRHISYGKQVYNESEVKSLGDYLLKM